MIRSMTVNLPGKKLFNRRIYTMILGHKNISEFYVKIQLI